MDKTSQSRPGPWNKSLNGLFSLLNYVIPKKFKSFSHWPTGWWFQQNWKICASQIGSSSPNRGEHIKYLEVSPPSQVRNHLVLDLIDLESRPPDSARNPGQKPPITWHISEDLAKKFNQPRFPWNFAGISRNLSYLLEACEVVFSVAMKFDQKDQFFEANLLTSQGKHWNKKIVIHVSGDSLELI